MRMKSDDTSGGQIQELQVRRTNWHDMKIVSRDIPKLGEDEVLFQIDKFALTANNVTYAVAGNMVGYWKFFPPSDASDEEWGIVPVWGIGHVVASQRSDVANGDAFYGYFPMATHLVAKPSSDDNVLKKGFFVEASPHRVSLPVVYNRYQRIAADPPELQSLQDERCLYFPLFVTSHFLFDHVVDIDMFGASQILIASASSKTAYGLAYLLHKHKKCESQTLPKVVGLTSESNVRFVQSLGTYDFVLTYSQMEQQVDSTLPTVFIDFASSAELTRRVHLHFRNAANNLQRSIQVGITHWEKRKMPSTNQDKKDVLPDPKPTFFFVPLQMEKRDKEWGPGVAMRKATESVLQMIQHARQHLQISREEGNDAVQSRLVALLDNKVAPNQGLMLSML